MARILRKILPPFLLLTLFSLTGNAQPGDFPFRPDSLIEVIQNESTPILDRADALDILCQFIAGSNPDTTIILGEQLLKIAEELDENRYRIRAKTTIAMANALKSLVSRPLPSSVGFQQMMTGLETIAKKTEELIADRDEVLANHQLSCQE